jgi:hypothetical protein
MTTEPAFPAPLAVPLADPELDDVPRHFLDRYSG